MLHDQSLAHHGGLGGLRDGGRLKSALERPRQRHVYEPSTGIIEMAAIYTAGIVRNRPFIDGNKRTGFLAGVLFLEINGYRFSAAEDVAARAVIDLASASLDENGYAAFLRAHAEPEKL